MTETKKAAPESYIILRRLDGYFSRDDARVGEIMRVW